MTDKVYVLDASAIIGGFSSKKFQNYITASVIVEIKDFKSKLFLESTIEEGSITIMEPDSLDIKNVTDVIKKSGDVLRLSNEDKNLVALAFKLKREKKIPWLLLMIILCKMF